MQIWSSQYESKFKFNSTGILQKKTMWFIGVEVEQETSAPPPKKNPGSAPARGHLHNRVKGHKQHSSTIAKHYKNVHGMIPQDLLRRFDTFKKCRNKFDCLVYEMLFISQILTYNRTLLVRTYFHNLCTLLC